MTTLPMLNDRPIDQWMVTELKDELQRRNLPVSGLKDDLVKRLFEAIQDEILDGGGTTSGGSPPAEGLKGGEAPGSADASVEQVSIQQNVDEGGSEVSKKGAADLLVSVTEAYDGSTVSTSEVSQEAVVGTADSQRNLDVVAELGSSLVDTAATDETDGFGLVSASSGNAIAKEVNSCSEGHSDTTEKTPTDDTSKKMAVDDVPSDVNGIDIKLGIDVHKAVTPPDDIALPADHEDADTVAAAEPEDDTGKEIVIDDVSSDVTYTSVELGVEAYCKIEQEEVPAQPDATALHSDPRDVDVVAAPTPPDDIALHVDHEDADTVAAVEPEDDTNKEIVNDDRSCDVTHINVKLGVEADRKIEQEEVPAVHDAIALHSDPEDAGVVVAIASMIPKDNFNENTSMYSNGHEDPNGTIGDCKLTLCGAKDQVFVVSQDLDSQIKCVSVFHDNTSTDGKNDVKGILDAKNSDLELEVKQEMVKPSSNIPSPVDHLHVLDDDKELHKSGTSLQELGSISYKDLDREEKSPDGSSHEKLDFDRSSGDESMDEAMMESKHADSNIKSDEHADSNIKSDEHADSNIKSDEHAELTIKSDDLGANTEVASEHVLKEVTLPDTVADGSNGHIKEVEAEEKPDKRSTSAEKRKPEDRGVIANSMQIKRQRLLNVGQQASKLPGAGTPKEVFRSTLKCSFGRSDSAASGDCPRERIVPPAQKPATTSLRIDGFVRPFTLKAAQELLGKTGSVCSFWMDNIKTHCYLTYSSVEEAVTTRNAVYNLQWPPNNGSYLVAEFVDPQEVKLKLEAPPPSQAPVNPSTATEPKAAPFQQSMANQALAPLAAATSRGMLPTPATLAKLPPISGPGPSMQRLPPPPRKLGPARTLDELFKKTQSCPRIYYLPLSEEEVSAKLAARNDGRGNSGL